MFVVHFESLMDQHLPLLDVKNISVKLNGKTLLSDISLSIGKGDIWAFIGPSGAGKSLLLQTIAGKTAVSKGEISHHYADVYLEKEKPVNTYRSYHDLIALTSPRHEFRNKSNTQQLYYQQRFNSVDSDNLDTVRDYLTGIGAKARRGHWSVEKLSDLFRLESLLDKAIIKLSNGESRRLTFAAALIRNPKFFLMDEPLTGLDVETRNRFNEILRQITESGIQVVLCTGASDLPADVSHIAILEAGRIKVAGKRTEISPFLQQIAADAHALSALNGENLATQLRELKLQEFQTLVKIDQATVRYGDKVVLENVNWSIAQGERWVLKGHNGAGKSTLLSLINGDNPQAYANNIWLFDKKRGTGESIWDIKKNIGYVSPEQHQYFPKDQTALQVVLSGYYDTDGLFRKSSEDRVRKAFEWMQTFSIQGLADRRLHSLSNSEQRLCLLARALVKRPPLLILDEPCQGLSSGQREQFKSIVNELALYSNISIIYVSHYSEDIPDCIKLTITLANGRVVAS